MRGVLKMETGSNKSLYTLIAVVVFGIFLSLSYFLFQDQMKGVLADVLNGTSVATSTKLATSLSVPTDAKYFTYVDNGNGTCTLTDYDINGPKDVVIPISLNSLTVTTIGNHAFQSKGITSVIMADSITSVSDGSWDPNRTPQRYGAFTGNNLNFVIFSNNLQYLGAHSFAYTKLSAVALPDSLTTISWAVFEGCPLTIIELPRRLTSIQGWALGGSGLKSVTLPETMTSLSDYAFVFSGSLKELKLPKSLEGVVDPTKIVRSYSDVSGVRVPTYYSSSSLTVTFY